MANFPRILHIILQERHFPPRTIPQENRFTCSSQTIVLRVATPNETKTMSMRNQAILVVAPLLWNKLPCEMWQAQSPMAFRKSFKTESFIKRPSITHPPQLCTFNFLNLGVWFYELAITILFGFVSGWCMGARWRFADLFSKLPRVVGVTQIK